MNDKSDDVTARLREGFAANAPELSPELVAGASARTAPRLPNIRRRRQVAGGAVAALAAVTVGSLVVTTPFERDPLFVAGGQGGNSTAAAAESSDAARLMIYRQYEYSAGAGLSKDGGSGTVYQLRRVGTPQERVEKIADIFGLDGSAKESDYFDPKYPTYVIGAQDGSEPSVTATWTGTGDWWYSNPGNAWISYQCTDWGVGSEEEKLEAEQACADAGAKAAEEAPNLAPDEAKARQLAADLFGKTGLDVSQDEVTVTADDWQTTATANLEVDGVETSLAWSVSWDKSGEISWASGPSVELVERGDFGTISAFDAVKRLDDYRWFGAAGPKYQGGFHTLAADSGAARMEAGTTENPDAPVSNDGDVAAEAPTEPTSPDSGGSTDGNTGTGEPSTAEPNIGGGTDGEPGTGEEPAPAPSEEPVEPTDPGVVATPEPMPVDPIEPTIEPMPEPEVVKVTIEKAEATLLLMWDSEGNAWLVPGFAMEQPEGMWGTVVSLEEGVIELPEPIEFEPMLEQDVMTR